MSWKQPETDWQPRVADGTIYKLIRLSDALWDYPPEIKVIGRTRSSIIFYPPVNWRGFVAKLPTMSKKKFSEMYTSLPLAVQNKPMKIWPQCDVCGFNTIVLGRCLKCKNKADEQQKN
jgi:hypothetical protein